jgi:UDP-GlcNAc:undecaprenyl-phosphate GlcNAc-1-phosphate transferase
VSVPCVKFFRWIAPLFGFVDYPGERKIHKKPTPLLGGAAIFFSVYLTVIIILIIYKLVPAHQRIYYIFSLAGNNFNNLIFDISKTVTFFFGGAIVFILGLIDDKRGTGPVYRLFVETIVAVLVVSLGIRPGIYEYSVFIGTVLAIVWIVGITNGFNLIDGINGLCAGNAIISAFIFLIVALGNGSFIIGGLLVVYIGAMLGFFIFNFPNGKIFLGSSGSMFIGYSLSVLVLFQSFGTSFTAGNPMPIFMPALILSVPLIDTLLVVYFRFKNNRPILQADTNHIHHRLRSIMMSDKEVVIFVFFVTFAVGINAILLYKSSLAESLIIMVQATTIFLMVVQLIRIKERKISLKELTKNILIAQIPGSNGKKNIFEGFVFDLSPDEISFCLVNIEKKYIESTYFIGKKMKLHLLPDRYGHHGRKPLFNFAGEAKRQEKVANNVVSIGFELEMPLGKDHLQLINGSIKYQ